MQFSKFLIASAAFAVANARVILTNPSYSGINCKSVFNITWSDNTGPVDLILRTDGNSRDVVTFATGLTGNSYPWTPGCDIPAGMYNLEIKSGNDVNYSPVFQITNTESTITSSARTSTDSSKVVSTTTAITTTTSTASTSVSAAPSGFSNSTSSARSSTSPGKTSTPTTGGSSTIPTNGSVVQYASPFALVLLAFVAIVTLN